MAATGAMSVELVTSICREDAHAIASALEIYATHVVNAGIARARALLYCKCAPRHDRCDAVLPNVGREAHTYLWYLCHRSQLADYTLFLQGDAWRHTKMFSNRTNALGKLRQLAINLRQKPASYLALSGGGYLLPVTADGYLRGRLRVACWIYRNFTGAAICNLHSSHLYTHFVVARDTIHRQPRARYCALLRTFEEPKVAREVWGIKGVLSAGLLGAAGLMERQWSMIFGCAHALGCPFRPEDGYDALLRQCPWAKHTNCNVIKGAKDVPPVHAPGGIMRCDKYHNVSELNYTYEARRSKVCSAFAFCSDCAARATPNLQL